MLGHILKLILVIDRLAFERSRDVCLTTYTKPEVFGKDFDVLVGRCRLVYDARQIAALKALYEWRDGVARKEDESAQ